MTWTRGLIVSAATLGCFSVASCRYFSTEGQINYGLNHYKMGLYNQAIPALMSAAESLEKKSPPDPRLVDVLIALGTMAQSEKRDDLAADFYLRALNAAEAMQPTDNTRLRNALVNLGMYDSYHQKAQEAVSILGRAAEISQRFQDQEFYAIDLDNLACAYQNLKQYEKATELQLQALRVASQLTPAQYPTRGTILHNLGSSYLELGRYKEAEASFKESIVVLSSGGRGVEQWRIKTAKQSYADLLRRTGRPEEAQKLESSALQQR